MGDQKEKYLNEIIYLDYMDPFFIFNKIQKEFNKHFEKFDKGFLKEYRRPSCNITQDKNFIKINVELPDIDKKDVILQIKKHEIEIRAEKRRHRERKEKGRYEREEEYKGYYRTIPISMDIIAEEAKAKFTGNKLTIVIPKTKKIVKKIKVQ